MDAIWLYLLLAFVVIVPIVWSVFFRRRVHAKARALGTAVDANLEQRVKSSNLKGLDRDAAILGTRVRFANASQGRAVIADVMASSKAATASSEHAWGISHGIPDMVTAVWSDNADGSGTFQATRARAMLSAFVQTRTWSKLLDQIQRTAAERGVETTTETHPLVKTTEVVDNDPIWVASA